MYRDITHGSSRRLFFCETHLLSPKTSNHLAVRLVGTVRIGSSHSVEGNLRWSIHSWGSVVADPIDAAIAVAVAAAGQRSLDFEIR